MKLKLKLLWIDIYAVIDWIPYGNTGNKQSSIGGLGGFFTNGMRWKDYLDSLHYSSKPYAEGLRKSILKNKFKFTGSQHQGESINGTPLFADGSVGTFSFRSWGDIMAGIWSEEENENYNYMDFYM